MLLEVSDCALSRQILCAGFKRSRINPYDAERFGRPKEVVTPGGTKKVQKIGLANY